jgi:azurin
MLSEPGALDRHYVPDLDAVLAHTLVLDPGQSDTLHLRAPDEPGDYPYLCTFPGHWMVMSGVMRVEGEP